MSDRSPCPVLLRTRLIVEECSHITVSRTHDRGSATHSRGELEAIRIIISDDRITARVLLKVIRSSLRGLGEITYRICGGDELDSDTIELELVVHSTYVGVGAVWDAEESIETEV